MMTNRIAAIAFAALLAWPLAGCRTGIRRTSNAIQGQGISSVDVVSKPEEKSFSYLTSENTAFDAQDVDVQVDPKTGAFTVKLGSINMVRTPSENQQFFAGQLRQGRAADTEALGAYADITGAVVQGAVKAAIEAIVPIANTRQEQKTARRGIAADRDVDLARIGSEGEGGGGEVPPE